MVASDSENYSKTFNELSKPQRKKPKQQKYSRSNTWSSAPPSSALLEYNTTLKTSLCDQQYENEVNNNAEKDDFIVPSISIISIEERIKIYEEKYKACMESSTQLSTWIKSTREKGPPMPLTEGYEIPTVASARSRLPTFLFSSLSTRPKRKNQTHHTQDISSTPVQPVRSSLSTFLKRATESLSTTYVPIRRQSQPAAKTSQPQTSTESNKKNKNRRFSLASSLNRFSLPKSNYSDMTDMYHHSLKKNVSREERPIVTKQDENEANKRQQQQRSRRHRFSAPPPPTPPLPSLLHHGRSQEHQQQRKQQNYTISAPILITSTSSCYTSSAATLDNTTGVDEQPENPSASSLTQSPSSIFLERLRYRNSLQLEDKDNKHQLQAILLHHQQQSDKKSSFYSRASTSSTDDDSMTPPSSPSSTVSSVRTPPLTSLYSLTEEEEEKKHHHQEDLSLFTSTPPTSSNNIPILSSIDVTTKLAATATATADISTKESDELLSTPLQQPKQQKKKRASLLTTAPSLSTIRLLSQKSHILKRQSMLA